jgi:diguanylate cyclase (GGDEF)-like protein
VKASVARLAPFVLAAACLASPAPGFAATAAPSTLDETKAKIALVDSADALPDPSGSLTIDDVRRRNADFRSAKRLDLTGTTLHNHTYWLRFPLERGNSQTTWALVIHADVGRVDWYAVSKNGAVTHVRGGLDFPHADDAIVHRVLVVPIAAYGATNYLRFVTNGGPSLAFVPIAAGAEDVLQRNTLHVFFMGYFVAIASLYLLLFAILRQRPLLQYSSIMAALTALLYVDSGAAYDRLPAMSLVQRAILHDVLIYAYFTLLAVFATTFLRLLQRDRFAFAFVVVAAALNAIGLVADFVAVPSWIEAVEDPATIAFFAALFFAGARAWRAGMRPAIFYTLAIFMVLLGYGVNAVATSGILDSVPLFLIYAFDGAIALEALLLGIAVTERIRETAREYERLLIASRELEDLALHDSLTGVLNRRAFDRGLADAWHTGAARRERLGLLMIDVDFFKQFNDRYGHQAGDECLRRVAYACAGCVRGGDLFARYGGEEFAAIVPNATMDDLDSIAQRMRAAVTELAIEHQTPAGHVTLSIGGAAKAASDVRSEQGLVELADAALYKAKERGRDRAVLDPEAAVR